MIARLACRNLFRNGWRSLLTAGGIAVAVSLLIFTEGIVGGFVDEMIRGATAFETGQMQVRSTAYADDEKLWMTFSADDRLYDRLAQLEGVRAVQPRVEFYGLIGTEKRSQVSRLVGIDPDRERDHGALERSVAEGSWFGEGAAETGRAVLGIDLARQIGIDVGDELVIFAESADGSLGDDLVRVTGLVEAGNRAIDSRSTFLELEDAQSVAATEGAVHEISIWTEGVRSAGPVTDRVRSTVDTWEREELAGETTFSDESEKPTELVVERWRDLKPRLAGVIDVSESSSWLYYLIVYFIAALGILNTQRMSARDRRREFGVMQAIGMAPGRLFGTVLVETALLSTFGALLGAGIGAAMNVYFAEYGLDLSMFAQGESFSYMGIAFSERVHFRLTVAAIVEPVLAILPVALVSGLWPALASARSNPAVAISGRD